MPKQGPHDLHNVLTSTADVSLPASGIISTLRVVNGLVAPNLTMVISLLVRVSIPLACATVTNKCQNSNGSSKQSFFPIHRMSNAYVLLDMVTQQRLFPSVALPCHNGHHQKDKDYENLYLFLTALDQKWQKPLSHMPIGLIQTHGPNSFTRKAENLGMRGGEQSMDYLVSTAISAVPLDGTRGPVKECCLYREMAIPTGCMTMV